MRRDFNVLKGESGGGPGDEEAASKATALAQLADGPTIEKIVQALSMLDLFGGQIYMQAVRAKFDAEGGVIPDAEAKDRPGRWETVGYVFRFETVDPSVLANRGSAFVVPGPIEVRSADDAELANNLAVAIANGQSDEPVPESEGPPEA